MISADAAPEGSMLRVEVKFGPHPETGEGAFLFTVR